MRKVKNKKKTNDGDDYKALLKAVDADDFAETIKRGLRIAKWPDCPPPVYLALARAYVNIDNKRENKLEAIRWLKKAEKTGADPLSTAELMITAQREMDNYSEAYRLAKETIEKNPDAPANKMQLFYALRGMLADETGNNVEAFEAFHKAWQMSGGIKTRSQNFSNILLTAQNLDYSAKDLFELHAVYDTIFADVAQYTHDLAARREEIRAGRKIRVGYISPDFHRHVAFHFFGPLLEHYDRRNFEVNCYSLCDRPDDATELIKNSVTWFERVTDLSYDEIAAKIYADGIDILVDLAGHTANTGLPVLAYKPAPVQLSGIGYLSTTGLKAVDYFITDETVDPPGAHEKFFTEKLLYLPSHFCYASYENLPEPTGAPCRQNGFVTFGVFNQYRKITDEMLGAWLKIMNAAENSRLLLKGKAYNDDEIVATAKERMKNIGFDLARVDFEKATQNYMHRYLEIDIALDTYPYTGGGTTCDALYMGVPVVSLYAERRNTRFGLGILSAMGLKYLATKSIDEYVTLATALANDFALLDDLHRKIRPMMLASPVGSSEKYARAMEKKYREILGI